MREDVGCAGRDPITELVAPSKEVVQFIKEAGGDSLKLCFQCGLCTASCPWNAVRNFVTRRVIHEAQLGLIDFESEETWLCVTCGVCIQRCPRGVQILDIMKAMRRITGEFGIAKVPDSVRLSVKNVGSAGNPLGEPQEKRADWAEGLDVKTGKDVASLLYFSCCVPAYDPKCKGVARSTAEVLQKAGVDFRILGTKENCCGESVRKTGNEKLFQSLVERNIAVFSENGVKSLLVSSPHCYHTFKNEYPQSGANIEVVHTTQYLLRLIEERKVTFSKELKKKVIYNDPCYLGRHNGIYDEPRQVLRSIPGLELMEFPDCRKLSFCCGGGGGGVWRETKKGERLADLRLEQAIKAGAEVLAVACPYCMSMFKDSQLTVDKGDTIQVKDISELVKEAM